MSFSKNSWSNYLYLKDQKILIFLITISLVVSAYLGFITPRLISGLYESYKDGGNTLEAIYALSFLFIGEYLISVVYQISINKYVQKALSHIRQLSYKNWLLSIETAGAGQYGDNKYPMGEVLSRILTDTEAVIEMVSTGSFKIFIDLTFIASCLIGFISLNTISGVALITAEVFVCIILVLGTKQMGKIYMEVRKSTGIMSRAIANLSGGFRFSYFHPNENYASKKGYASFEDFLIKQLKANIWDASYFSIAESLFPILLVLLVVIFPYSGIVEMSVLAAIIDLIQRSISPIKEIAGKISSIQRARTGIIRIDEFNDDLATLPKSHFDIAIGTLSVKEMKVHVSRFEYPSKDGAKPFVLSGIDFTAKPGELIGIVGQSGCGKSTLLKILATDIIVDDSEIEITTTDDKKLVFSGKNLEQLMDYKSQVSIVSQDSHVFSNTLRFNITLASGENAEFERFWQDVSLRIKYLNSWGIKSDDLINTKELSLGQKQLLSALRSCFLSKPIVLFDEISSSLDSELEEALRQLVLLIQKKSLTFIVAHRIETIIGADQILVMSEGHLIDRGTHSNLMSSSATYQEFIAQLNAMPL
jgi:ATP-binding cassette subfamily B protein